MRIIATVDSPKDKNVLNYELKKIYDRSTHVLSWNRKQYFQNFEEIYNLLVLQTLKILKSS